MPINSIVTKKSTSQYPKLMTSKDDGYVYLFIASNIAIPLNNPDYMRELDMDDISDWNTQNFKDFNDSITLQS